MKSATGKAEGPSCPDVAPLDEHLYPPHIATGDDGVIFPVMPVQNVVGGFGFAGCLSFRDWPVMVGR